MKASDLHLRELLEMRPDQGRLSLKNRRMLLWDADAFGILRQELIESVGTARARPMLRRFGYANGYRDALTLHDLFSWDDDREWWLSCPAMQSSQGKVLALPRHLVVDRAAGLFEMQVEWQDSYEAEQHMRVFGAAAGPICWSVSGYASGFSTALMGREVYVVETQCMAAGAPSCRVVGKTREAWGEQGEHHAADYEAQNLSAELEAREEELRRQRRVLRRRERELEKLRGGGLTSRGGIVTRSRAMEGVLALADTVAKVDTNVLITGESGVGKELLARLVHDESPRAEGPFVAVNCGALPEPLLESELFGHVRGAFTGADADKKGLFEAARGGTIFLDEIGETTETTQVKLLRVIQEREVRAVGSTASTPIDVRVIAATNRDLGAMVEEGSFRKDLYYRLKVVQIEVPALRDRAEDILPLAREFIQQACQSYGLPPRTLEPEAVDALTAHRWPGNVRELHNAIERAVVLAGERARIGADDLPSELRERGKNGHGLVVADVLPMADLERRYIMQVLEHFDGNRTHTARALGIGANTLWRKLKAWGVPPAR